MKRKEALQLVSSLLDPATPMDEKQLAAARLSELIRILLPEEEIRNRHHRYRCDQDNQVVFLEGNLVRSSRFSLPYYGNARIIIT